MTGRSEGAERTPAGGPPWWFGLAPTTTPIRCAGVVHELRWERGALHADGHDDPDAEAALVALGSPPPPCLAARALWREFSTDPHVVTLGRRPGEPTVGIPVDDDTDLEGRWRHESIRLRAGPSSASLGSAALDRIDATERRRRGLLNLLSLPAAMLDRLLVEVLASCAERWTSPSFRAEHGLRLGAALHVRASPAVRRLGERVGAGTPAVAISPLHPDQPGTLLALRLEAGEAPALSAELPIGWLASVWGRGLSEPDGEFVLDVRSAAPDGETFEVFVAEWEPAGPLTWEAAPVPATVFRDPDGIRRVSRHW